MFTCITCTKATSEEERERGEEGREIESGTPNTKEAVKSLTSQLKGMALKFSGSYKQSKSSTGSSSVHKKGQGPFPEFDAISEGVPYPYMGGASSGSTPAWDITGTNFPSERFGGHMIPKGPELASAGDDPMVEDEDEAKEWVAQVEPGVHITFVSLPNGGNDLKRIRFSREMFDKWHAQKWWGENYDRIMELYNVQRFNRQALNTPSRSEDEQRDSSYSRMTSAQDSPMAALLNKDWNARNKGFSPSEAMDQGSGQNMHGMEASRTTTSSRDELHSMSNASEMETEWIEQDEPGVFITIRLLPDGSKDLRRVRFSRERFEEGHAKKWWEENRERIQAQYL